MSEGNVIDLPEAALRMGVAWHRAYHLVLTRQLKGERRDGHWYVDTASLERLVAERAEPEVKATA